MFSAHALVVLLGFGRAPPLNLKIAEPGSFVVAARDPAVWGLAIYLLGLDQGLRGSVGLSVHLLRQQMLSLVVSAAEGDFRLSFQ